MESSRRIVLLCNNTCLSEFGIRKVLPHSRQLDINWPEILKIKKPTSPYVRKSQITSEFTSQVDTCNTGTTSREKDSRCSALVCPDIHPSQVITESKARIQRLIFTEIVTWCQRRLAMIQSTRLRHGLCRIASATDISLQGKEVRVPVSTTMQLFAKQYLRRVPHAVSVDMYNTFD